MAPAQFLVDPADLGSDRAVVRGDEARHARSVRRVRVGEQVRLIDGSGRVAEATVEQLSPATVEARVDALWQEPERRPRLTVVAGLTKGAKLDLVVQKLTELGVASVLPATCRRSVVVWDARRAGAARARWAAIAAEAAKQSLRARIPAVGPVAPLDHHVAAAPAPCLVLWERGEVPLSSLLPAEAPDELTLVVGPEGGFDAGEVEACVAAGARPASLGPLILRAETAAIAAAAAVAFHYGLLG